MNKCLLFIACLFACTFARLLKNEPLPCPYHVKVSGTTVSDMEVFAVENMQGYPLYMKVVRGKDYYSILRCDERNDKNLCFQQVHDSSSSEPCSEDFLSSENARFSLYVSQFSYDEKRYPQSTACADGSSGCKLYCDTKDVECVVTNVEGFFVMADGINWTLYESPSMDVFEVDKCDASDPHPHLDAPVNSCGKLRVYEPRSINCAYHVKIVQQINPIIMIDSEYFGVQVGGSIKYAKLISGSGAQTELIRCDVTNEKGECYYSQKSGSDCHKGWRGFDDIERFYIPDLPDSLITYDSANYPKPVECPGNSSGCLLYCEDILENNCAVVDAGGYVADYGKGAVYTFFDPPSIDEFDDDCGSEPLPASVDYCAMVGTVSPIFPECKFHIHSDGISPTRRDSTFNFARSEDKGIDFYFIKVEDDIVALKIDSGEDYSVLYRFDIVSASSMFYVWAGGGDKCEEKYTSFDLIPEIKRFYLPQSIQYNISEYPVDVKCPDETDGCKLFCDFSGSNCAVVDTNGYFIRTKILGNQTYDSDFTFDVFETVRCNDVTRVPAPSTDVCPQSSSTTPSSSATSTSTSATTSNSSSNPTTSSTISSIGPTSQPSINPSLSSASVVKAILCVVVIAIAVALL